MKNLPRLLGLVLAAVLTSVTAAQTPPEQLTLSADEFRRLAIMFAPARDAGSQDGMRVPATVISPPGQATSLNAQFSGLLTAWLVDAGATVSIGQPLARLRSEQLLQAQQGWLDAELALDSAAVALRRDQSLHDEGIIASARLDETRRLHILARQTELAARQLLITAGLTAAELQQLKTDGSGLGVYTPRAAVSGTIGQWLLAPGTWVSDGDALLHLQPDANAWISARIPSALAGNLRTGQSLLVADSTISLTVRQIDQRVDALSQTVGMLAEFEHPVPWLTGQLIGLTLPPAQAGVRVPADAVVYVDEDTVVYVRTATGVEARQLSLVPSGRGYIAAAGLTPGEQLVVQGAAILKGIQLGLGGSE